MARHFGLATCLLDWSHNPLGGLYFACTKRPATDGAVYCYWPDEFVNEDTNSLSTLSCNGAGFTPRALSPRILNQRAVFTVHLPVNSEIVVKPVSDPFSDQKSDPNLAKIVIPTTLKEELLTIVNDYGINQERLFPDLEGLSLRVNWETQKNGKVHTALRLFD